MDKQEIDFIKSLVRDGKDVQWLSPHDGHYYKIFGFCQSQIEPEFYSEEHNAQFQIGGMINYEVPGFYNAVDFYDADPSHFFVCYKRPVFKDLG